MPEPYTANDLLNAIAVASKTLSAVSYTHLENVVSARNPCTKLNGTSCGVCA